MMSINPKVGKIQPIDIIILHQNMETELRTQTEDKQNQ